MINTISFPNLNLSFTVNRAAFEICGISVYWYGLIICFGIALACVYGFKEIKKTDISADDFLNMILISLPVAIICARAYYVIFSLDYYLDNPADIFNIRHGGLAIYGGIIGIMIVIFIYTRRKSINLGALLDIVAVGLLIGQCIGRWGNFVNGEAFGSKTSLPWAMTIVTDGRTRASSVHPTFLYESLWNFAAIIALTLYKPHKKFDGELGVLYMVIYGAGRFLIEGLRADSLYIFGTIRVSQLLSLILFVAGIFLLVFMRKRNKKALAAALAEAQSEYVNSGAPAEKTPVSQPDADAQSQTENK